MKTLLELLLEIHRQTLDSELDSAEGATEIKVFSRKGAKEREDNFQLHAAHRKKSSKAALVIKKKFYIRNIKRNVMSSVNLNMKEEYLGKCCLCNALTYIAITPPIGS